MLPSNELIDLHATVPICLSGDELPANCDLRYGQFYYFYTFNKLGELTHVSNLSKGLTERTERGVSLPVAFLELAEESLKIQKSLDSCERQYITARGTPESYRVLRNKLDELERIGSMRVAALLRKHADQMEQPELTRYHALAIEMAAVKEQVINKNSIDQLARRIEAFLTRNPDHPQTDEILKQYFQSGLKYTYGVQAHCSDLADVWRGDTENQQAAALNKLADRLEKLCRDHMYNVDKSINQLKGPNSWEAPRLYAQKGDAGKMLDALKEAVAVPVLKPIYEDWRTKAKSEFER